MIGHNAISQQPHRHLLSRLFESLQERLVVAMGLEQRSATHGSIEHMKHVTARCKSGSSRHVLHLLREGVGSLFLATSRLRLSEQNHAARKRLPTPSFTSGQRQIAGERQVSACRYISMPATLITTVTLSYRWADATPLTCLWRRFGFLWSAWTLRNPRRSMNLAIVPAGVLQDIAAPIRA